MKNSFSLNIGVTEGYKRIVEEYAISNIFIKNNDGVSAIIGVILMVSITLVLAAVLATLVIDMASGTHTTKNAVFTIKRTGANTAEVTFSSSGNANSVSDLATTTSGVTWIGSAPSGTLTVGNIWKMNVPSTTTVVILTATIDNDERVVVLEADV